MSQPPAAYWHPFAAMDAVAGTEFVITRGDDVWLWDDAGRRHLDATASLWCVNAGHGRPEIIDAVTAQMRRLATYQTFGDFANEPALALARRLAALAPVPGGKVFLVNGGGDAIDTAAKIAREYFARTGAPERTVLISREHAYHGTYGFGTTLAGIPANRMAGPLVPDAVRVPYDDVDALEAELERLGPERVAAFFAEPVIGAGGVLPPPPGYLERARQICTRHGVLFIADSVICGFGRLGDWFGLDRFGIVPDLIVFAKGVTSGYLPLGGVVAHERVAAPFWEPGAAPFRHGATYSGHPTACAAALANLDVLERDGLLKRADALEGPLHEALRTVADHPLVAEVRAGVGVLGAVGLDPQRLRAEPDLPARIARAARERGVLVRPMAAAIAVSPPLTFADAHLDLLADALGGALDAVG
ncbi:aminotransferase family protein [Pseudonocardia asaccharolytica]|uniref:Aspartate aminotransferase family protein n=1 Tax=Pseudonocardia asaccharolytica DSM 44247 = NBRC 16224 TaxID=1123024 RepID=A0A511CXU9_9PSEU|nr:aminotransferase class III-fold pyridoxal phosphate-dependent enzyme [Pseudonocardia asaccharolytica]GEL17362.1 aspartate aminotransferase family protein [Pseudonocardia asaccharolytica DSM 44247 = NBRC 16224]